MSAAPAIERIAAHHAEVAGRLPGGADWAARRGAALARLAALGLPGRRDENWKYLDHARIEALDFRPADVVEEPPPAPAGVRIEPLADWLSRHPGESLRQLAQPGDAADERYALLADAFAGDGLHVRIAADAAPAAPLRLAHAVPASGSRHRRLRVEVGAGAQVTVIEQVTPDPAAGGFLNLAADWEIGTGARVTHIRLLEPGPEASYLETLDVSQASGSQYEQRLFVLDGRTLRSGLHLTLAGTEAAAELAGLFMVDGERQVDLYTCIAHAAPMTRSTQDFRGIGAERGRGAYNGRVIVQAGARGADSRQSSRNLLLTPLAEINSRPQLEILTDDVKCQHGATTGTLDPAQMFYLLSRGLDPDTARGLLTFAFCEDIVLGLADAALRGYVEERVVGRLPDRDLIRSFR